MYMKYKGNAVGCFVNEGQTNIILKKLNDVTTVERILCIKNDIKLSKASNTRTGISKNT